VSEATLGVYIHIPFCERVCPYCDFAVVGVRQLDPALEDRYAAGLLRELAQRRAAFAGRRLTSLYLGGGTPSLCRPETIARLVASLREAFAADGPIETTLEVNPSTLERDRLPDFARAGVNRVSLGVQSFDDGVLHRLGRAHRASEARTALRACRDVDFDALAVDLIFAAPGQSRESLARDLAELLDFAPQHVSAYELSIEAGTPFATAAARGQLALPDEGEAVALLEQVVGRLEAAGYERYELSNYARPGFQAVHNRRYWERLPVLGLGAGAFSTDPATRETPFGVRRSNLRAPDAYLARVEADRSPEAGPPETLAAATARGEAMFLGLRTRRGVDSAAFAAEFGHPPRSFFSGEIELLVGQGLLRERATGELALSTRGRLLADSVFAHFVGSSEASGD
jgi:oxygen-independent coproporphyrinogen-3 oxidase